MDQQDIFTANQVIHLQPLLGAALIEPFRAANRFVDACYPNSRDDENPPPMIDVTGRGLSLAKRVLEALMTIPGPFVEALCRRAYGWYLQRRAGSWRSPEQVRLQSDYLKLHTQSHRHAVLDRFEATVATLMRMAKRPRTDDLFTLFPDLPSMPKRTAAEQMDTVHRKVEETRQRAGEQILRQRAASERVRAAIAGPSRRFNKP